MSVASGPGRGCRITRRKERGAGGRLRNMLLAKIMPGVQWIDPLMDQLAGDHIVRVLEAAAAHEDEVGRKVRFEEGDVQAAPVARGEAVAVDDGEGTDQRRVVIVVMADVRL